MARKIQMNIWRSNIWQEMPVKVVAGVSAFFPDDSELSEVLGRCCHALIDHTWVVTWKDKQYQFTEDGVSIPPHDEGV